MQQEGRPNRPPFGIAQREIRLSRLRLSPSHDGNEHSIGRCGDVMKNLGLPEAKHEPTGALQRPCVAAIPGDIRSDFCGPIGCVCTVGQPISPVMPPTAVPEITIAKYRYAGISDHEIRLARKVRSVKSVTQPAMPEFLAEEHFRLGVTRSIASLDPRR
jgi:hypothetical protein